MSTSTLCLILSQIRGVKCEVNEKQKMATDMKLLFKSKVNVFRFVV